MSILIAAFAAVSVAMAALAAACALLLPVRAHGVEAELVVRVERGARGVEHALRGAALIAGVAGARVRIECPSGENAEFLRQFLRGRESVMYIYEGEPDGRDKFSADK